jgi:hypothetical protein
MDFQVYRTPTVEYYFFFFQRINQIRVSFHTKEWCFTFGNGGYGMRVYHVVNNIRVFLAEAS